MGLGLLKTTNGCYSKRVKYVIYISNCVTSFKPHTITFIKLLQQLI